MREAGVETMPQPIHGKSPPDVEAVPATGGTGPDWASTAPEPPRRALVVEPSEAERARLRGELTAAGLEVHACDDLDAAEQAMTRVQPSLVLARWDLPSGSGLDLVRRLGERGATDWVPVILHGGRASAEDRVAALDLGAFDVLAPTPGDAELRARLRAALRVRERMDFLERRAYRDGLTGLINRGALEDQLRRHWEASRRHGTSLSVLIVDLDRFKELNDTHGHPAGDEALRRTAAVLTRSVRGSDIVARYGGDEFVVAAPACPPESATLLALRFRAGLAAPSQPAIPLTLSVGIAGTDGTEPARLDDLLHCADQALYLAKRSGRDAVALFDPSRKAPRLVLSR
jgi:diguanylate cyclase (GGDEF)-like protein